MGAHNFLLIKDISVIIHYYNLQFVINAQLTVKIVILMNLYIVKPVSINIFSMMVSVINVMTQIVWFVKANPFVSNASKTLIQLRVNVIYVNKVMNTKIKNANQFVEMEY